jgi:hypothetical protein
MYGTQTRRTSRFDPIMQRDGASGTTINYSLPSGKVFDLSTLRVHVEATHPATPQPLPPGAPVPRATIPSPAECLIQTLNVAVGGAQLNQINNYGQLFKAWSTYNTPARDFGRRMMTSAASSFMQQRGNRDAAGSMRVILSSWLGLLGSGALLDTSERGTLQIEMLMANSTVTGTRFIYQTFLTIDELPYGTGDAQISYADYRTNLSFIDGQDPFGVIQTDNFEDHRLQYVCATMLDPNYNDPAFAVEPVPDLGFTQGFRHTRSDIEGYHFEFDNQKFTHEIKYWEFLDRLKEALAGSANSLELPLLMARGADLQLEELCDSVFLAGESALGKGIPDGTIEVIFRTTKLPGQAPISAWVLMIARYACVL